MKNFVLLQWLAILFFATGVGYAQPRIWYVDPNDFNCSLQSSSPCINTGNNLYDPINITKDVIGNVRKWDGIVDRGAYEYQFR